jgi:ABC-type multidrug transport system fused ATPase/permease subunit
MIFYERKENDWRLVSILVDLFQSNIHCSFSMIFWFLIDFVIHSTITYLTVGFLSSANIEILTLLLIFRIIESFIHLRVVSTEKTFVLSCIRRLYTLVHIRLFGTDWHRLKLADHEEMRRKITEACSSIQSLIESIIENCNVVYGLISAIVTISLLCPWKATIGLILAYLTFFLIYVRQRSEELSALRAKNSQIYDELYEKSNRVMGRTLDYILHREEDKLISTSSSLRIAIEGLYYTSEYVANRLLFSEELLGKACTFILISILLSNNTNPFVVIPIYHYLSSLVSQLDFLINISSRCIRLIKDYDLLQPMLEEYKPRFQASQFNMEQYLTIHNLHFTYEEVKARRKRFTLELDQPITFQMGETILVTGNSGAGYLRFYSIINKKEFF